jgi:lysyl-tRNA synthetase, class II
MMDIVESVCRATALALNGTTKLIYQGQELDFGPTWARVSIPEALEETTGIDILAHPEYDSLQAAIRERGLKVERKPGWGKQIDELISVFVEPRLIQPTFLCDHPKVMSPLAKHNPTRPVLTERFEAYVSGFEIGNGYSELNDPFDQEQRFLEQGRDYVQGDDEAHQMDNDYLNALMYGMPPTGGLGLGIDRMAMLFTDQDTIREVILFPHLRQREA